MLFNSFAFVVLFLLIFGIYYIPDFRKLQILILIISSFIFYSWNSPQLIILLLLSILINGITSFALAHINKNQQFIWALIGILFNFFILAFFKYGTLVANLTNKIFIADDGIFTLLLYLPLPIGISFYTFEGISLTSEVIAVAGFTPSTKP